MLIFVTYYYVDLCDLWLCWSLWPVTMLIFVSSFYLWLCWYLSASLLGAMTGRVKCGTRPRGRSYTPWRGTAMWCTPLHSTIHMGKTFKTSQGNFCNKNTQGSIFTFETYMRWIHTISGNCQRDFNFILQMKMLKMLNLKITNEDVENVKSENIFWQWFFLYWKPKNHKIMKFSSSWKCIWSLKISK